MTNKMPPKGFARNETGYIKHITREEFETLLTGLDRWDFKFRLIFNLMFRLGLRRKEVCQLRWADFLNNYEAVRIRDVKNGEIRLRYISRKLKLEIISYEFIIRHSIDGKKEYMFTPSSRSGSKYKHIQPNSVTAKFKQARDRTGLNDFYYTKKDGKKLYRISPHTCRHWFITKVYENTDLITTQRIIGHKKSETTARYIFKEDLKETEKKVINDIF